MRQQCLDDGGFVKLRKSTRKKLSLDVVDQIIPWQELSAAIKVRYPEPGGEPSPCFKVFQDNLTGSGTLNGVAECIDTIIHAAGKPIPPQVLRVYPGKSP